MSQNGLSGHFKRDQRMIFESLSNRLQGIDMRHPATDKTVPQHLEKIGRRPLRGIDAVQQKLRAEISLFLDDLKFSEGQPERVFPTRPDQDNRLAHAAFVNSMPSLKLISSV